MIFDRVSYCWSGKYRLHAKVEGAVKFLALTTLIYTPPVCPPATDPKIVAIDLTDKQARAK